MYISNDKDLRDIPASGFNSLELVATNLPDFEDALRVLQLKLLLMKFEGITDPPGSRTFLISKNLYQGFQWKLYPEDLSSDNECFFYEKTSNFGLSRIQ